VSETSTLQVRKVNRRSRTSNGGPSPPASHPQAPPYREERAVAQLSKWQETLFGIDFLLLLSSPVFYGIGVPHGDGSGVVLIPGFLDWDAYLIVMSNWLKRLGYRPYSSGIGLNAECPNLLIEHELARAIQKARRETGKRIHLIGHSLGGVIARSAAIQRPGDIASVIMLGAPFRGTVAHRSVLFSSELVRRYIHRKHGSKVPPECYTGSCTCDFVTSLRREIPHRVGLTAIYTRQDGVVDWHYCITGDPREDVEVPGTHSGLAFNPAVYSTIANRLARKHPWPPTRKA
jgi:pimeloyl-ACP methyl ester carboxylesterase